MGIGTVTAVNEPSRRPADRGHPSALRSRAQPMANGVAALLFIGGCVAFYSPRLYDVGVTLFLAGSIVMLASSVAEIVSDRHQRRDESP